MIVKPLEIRDAKTFIGVLAIRLSHASEAEAYLFERNGFPDDTAEIIVVRLSDFAAHYDPYHWSQSIWGRTMHEAHKWIRAHFDELEPGDVVDVEFILGEKSTKKIAERLEP